MHVFVTGATGFVGSAIVPELLDAGHDVVGLARSDQGASELAEAGADVQHGSLEDLDSLTSAATAADGVIHCAYIHDFSQMEMAARTHMRAIAALGDALAGSGRPLVVAAGTGLLTPGRVATEHDGAVPGGHPRAAAEPAALALASRDVRVSLLRLPIVHGIGDHGFVPVLIDIARTRGVSAYIGDGSGRWPAVHRLDAAPLFRLALESAPAGAVLHAVADEGVPTRQIAEVIGRHLDLPVASVTPEDAPEHFGWIAGFFGLDIPASSALTRERMGWQATHPGLIDDLEQGHYFEIAQATAA